MELHFLDYIHRTSGARMTELDLRVFHWWGRYCLHLTFNACLRTIGPRYRIRTGPICLEGRDASRWHQSRIWWIFSHLCINIIPRFSRKIKFLHTQTYKLELWFEVVARKAHYRKMRPRLKVPRQAGVILGQSAPTLWFWANDPLARHSFPIFQHRGAWRWTRTADKPGHI